MSNEIMKVNSQQSA